jgi:glycosyltransferase involved in cell wall biosynthesis
VRVVHISTFSEFGAGKAALRLHRALSAAGWDSTFYASVATAPDVTGIPSPGGLRARLRRGLRRRWLDSCVRRARRRGGAFTNLFSHDRTPFGREALRHLPSGDVLNLHWVTWFFDPTLLHRLSRPAVWTLHDMNAFTGGCHYDAGCGRFTDGCGRCPALGAVSERDLSARIWRHKRQVLLRMSPRRLHFVAPSRWLARQAERSPVLARFSVSVIPYGLDLNVFAPREKTFARHVFDLPQNARIVLFIADRVNEERKGIGLLIKAAQRAPHELEMRIATVGRVGTGEQTPPNTRHLGFVVDERLLALAYCAADVTVVPSLADNLPLTSLESLACGTPVVGFAAGGVTEVVGDGETGLLVPPADVGALGSALAGLLADDGRRAAMGTRARRTAEEKYSAGLQARRYIELYRRLLDVETAASGTAGAAQV